MIRAIWCWLFGHKFDVNTVRYMGHVDLWVMYEKNLFGASCKRCKQFKALK